MLKSGDLSSGLRMYIRSEANEREVKEERDTRVNSSIDMVSIHCGPSSKVKAEAQRSHTVSDAGE